MARYKMTVEGIDDINHLKESVAGYIQEIAKLRGLNSAYETKIDKMNVDIKTHVQEKKEYFENQEQIYIQNKKTIQNTHQTIKDMKSKLIYSEKQLKNITQESKDSIEKHESNLIYIKQKEMDKYEGLLIVQKNIINKEHKENVTKMYDNNAKQIDTITNNNLNTLNTLKYTNGEALSTMKQEICRLMNENNKYKLNFKNLEDICKKK